MDNPTTSLIGCIAALLAIIVASLYSNSSGNPLIHVEHNVSISASATIQHVTNLISLGDAETYEEGRRAAREYIKSSLVKGGVPQDRVLWHYFEWKEKQHGNTLLWTGVNVLVWLNNTALPSQKVRVFGAHYDTFFWGKNSTAGACSLAGAALLLETAINIYTYQQEQRKANPDFEEIPYLFIFFDHHEPGALGAKSLIDQMNHEEIAYFIGVSSVGFQGSSPLLQTFPYDHLHQSIYTPDWLASLLLQAGISNNVPVKIGGTTKIRSLLYQAYRYHWNVVSHLGEDGPFAWQGVPSALLTDYDDIFEPSPHYHRATDQVWTLDEKKVKEFSKLLASFIVISSKDTKFEVTKSEHPLSLQQFISQSPIVTQVFSFVFNGVNQYLAVGVLIVGFVEIASMSFVIICVVCFSSVYQYQRVYSSEYPTFQLKQFNFYDTRSNGDSKMSESDSESSSDYDFFKPPSELTSELSLEVLRYYSFYTDFTPNIRNEQEQDQEQEQGGYWQGHKILVVHMCRDVIVMSKFGVRTHDLRELRLGALLLVYLLHSILLLVYGYDYKRKKAKLNKENI